MRILIALVFLTGCDDTGSNGFLPPNDAFFAGDGPADPCRSYSGVSPDDWVSPEGLADATAEGVRGCFIEQRLLTATANRCTQGAPYAVIDEVFTIDTCKAQPAGQPQQDGFWPECHDLWASGTCTDIINSSMQCQLGLALVRDQGKLACP